MEEEERERRRREGRKRKQKEKEREEGEGEGRRRYSSQYIDTGDESGESDSDENIFKESEFIGNVIDQQNEVH